MSITQESINEVNSIIDDLQFERRGIDDDVVVSEDAVSEDAESTTEATTEEPATEEPATEADELRARIADMTERHNEQVAGHVAAMDTLRDNYTKYRNTVQEDFLKMSEILNEAATDANLCSEYEDALDEVNAALKGPYALEGRMKDFTVTVSFSVMVSSRDDTSARELVEDDPSTYMDCAGSVEYDVEEY